MVLFLKIIELIFEEKMTLVLQKWNTKLITDDFVKNVQHCVLVTFFCRVNILTNLSSNNNHFEYVQKCHSMQCGIWPFVQSQNTVINMVHSGAEYIWNLFGKCTSSPEQKYHEIVYGCSTHFHWYWSLFLTETYIQTSKWAYIHKDDIDFRTIKFTVEKGGYQRQNGYITSIVLEFDVLLKKVTAIYSCILLFVLRQETYIWKRVASFLYYSFVQTLED